jgi:hypothetical protein
MRDQRAAVGGLESPARFAAKSGDGGGGNRPAWRQEVDAATDEIRGGAQYRLFEGPGDEKNASVGGEHESRDGKGGQSRKGDVK